MELSELPGPARERAESETGRKIKMAMAEREIVAGLRRVEDDVAVQSVSSEIRRLGIAALRVDLDRSRFEDVIVQESPGWPAYELQSFVTWNCPLRGDTDEASVPDAVLAEPDTVVLALGLVGPPAHATAASTPAPSHARRTRFVARLMILFLCLSSRGFVPAAGGNLT
jgi:hypothetical protein